MQTQSFHSEVVRSAVYCDDTEALTIYFCDGRKQGYYNVPLVVAEQLFKTADPAKFIADYIDSAYSPLHASWKSIFRRRRIEIDPTVNRLNEVKTLRQRAMLVRAGFPKRNG